MKKFPEINENQFVLLRAYSLTGHILDDQFERVSNDDQECYTVFDSKKEAIFAAQKMMAERENIEIVLYDFRNAVVATWE